MLEAKGNLLRLKQELSLTEEEAAAVDEGVELMKKLIEQLADTPTPAGPPPREIRTKAERIERELPVLRDDASDPRVKE